MKNNLLFVFFCCLVLFQTAAIAQTRYLNRVFGASTSSTAVYATATNVVGSAQPLSVTVYQPTGDTAKLRPAVLVYFGGGFVSGARTDANVVALCDSLTRRGYVAIAADYRIGVLAATTAEVERAIYRAVQDVKASVRWAKGNSQTYKIDPARIYTAGFSAGAVASVLNEFWDQSEVTANINTALMGLLDNNGNTYTGSGKAAGIISVAGGIPDLNWMSPGSKLIAMAHAAADPVVPCNTGLMAVINAPLSGSCAMLSPVTTLGYNASLFSLPSGHLPTVGGVDWSAMVVSLLNTKLYPVVVANDNQAPLVAKVQTVEYSTNATSYSGSSIRIVGSKLTGITSAYINNATASYVQVDNDTLAYVRIPNDFATSAITTITLTKANISSAIVTNIQNNSNVSIWTGATSNVLDVAGNWHNNTVPSAAGAMAIIDNTTANVPDINSNTISYTLGNLNIGYLGDINGTFGNLHIGGSLVVNNGFQFGAHVNVTFEGTTTAKYQENPLLIGGATKFNILWVKANPLTTHSDITVVARLNMTGSGRIVGSAGSVKTVKLTSIPTNQSHVVFLGDGAKSFSLSDNIQLSIDKLYTSGANNWFNQSQPLEGQTIQQIKNQATITGSWPGATATHTSSFYFYDPTVTTNSGYTLPSGMSDALTPGLGYRIWMFPSFFAGSSKLNFTGAYSASRATTSLTLKYCSNCLSGSENGFNLIGNPMLSSMTWANLSRTNVTDEYWIASGGVFAQWNGTLGTGTNGADGQIPFMSGFFVKATGPGANIGNFLAATDLNSRGRTGANTNPTMRLTLSNNNITDEVATVFANGLSDAYVLGEDSDEMQEESGISQAFEVGNKLVGIQGQSPIGSQIRRLPIAVKASTARTFSLSLTAMDNFGNQVDVYLIDRNLVTRTPLTIGSPVTISTLVSNETGRFEVELVPATITTLPSINKAALILYPSPTTGSLSISGLGNEIATVTIIDAQGKTVLSAQQVSNQSVLDVSTLVPGIYAAQILVEGLTQVLQFSKQ